jgi:hypothetical protein
MTEKFKLGAARHVPPMEKSNAYTIWVRRSEGKRPLGRPRRRCEGNIEMYLGETGWIDMQWTDLGRYGDQWRALVNTPVYHRVL